MKILKTLFMAMVCITLVAAPAYASPGKGKGEWKPKQTPGNNGNNGKGNSGKSNAGNKGGKSVTHSNNGQSNKSVSNPAPAKSAQQRKNSIDRARGQADVRANRPDKGKGSRKSAERIRGKSDDHRKAKVDKVKNLFAALGKARWSHNPHDDRGQGNMGNVDMRDPYGHDKDSGREKSERGRPIREEEPEQPLFDLASMVSLGLEMPSFYAEQIALLEERMARYQYAIENYNYNQSLIGSLQSAIAAITNAIEHYQKIEYYQEASYIIRVNMDDTIDYTVNLSPPEGFEGTKLIVTTSLVAAEDYQDSTMDYRLNPDTGTYTYFRYEVDYTAGEAVMEQTQEVTLGSDNTLALSFDPPIELASSQGFNANVSVTVTEPISGQSYTTTNDKALYLYRCPYGKITNSKTGQPIVAAKITVHFEDGSIVPLDKASNPTATNPQITDATGRYGVKLMTNRKYYLTAKAKGYKPYKSEIFTEKWHVLREDIKLVPAEEQIASK